MKILIFSLFALLVTGCASQGNQKHLTIKTGPSGAYVKELATGVNGAVRTPIRYTYDVNPALLDANGCMHVGGFEVQWPSGVKATTEPIIRLCGNNTEYEQAVAYPGDNNQLAYDRERENELQGQGRDNSNLWATAFVALAGVTVNSAYPNSGYKPAPNAYIPTQQTQTTYVAPKPEGCTSDLACGVGMQCVKPPLSSAGQCMKPVDSYGATSPGGARPGSSLMNTSPTGRCTTTTDCPIGFTCDSTLKACVK